jgi:hypothetical protein
MLRYIRLFFVPEKMQRIWAPAPSASDFAVYDGEAEAVHSQGVWDS